MTSRRWPCPEQIWDQFVEQELARAACAAAGRLDAFLAVARSREQRFGAELVAS